MTLAIDELRSRKADGRTVRIPLTWLTILVSLWGSSLSVPDSIQAGPLPQQTAEESDSKAVQKSPSAPPTDSPDSPKQPEHPFPNRVKAPDNILDGGREWLNTSGEIRLKDLRGKIVLLDFWTYCCINCMHVLPELKYLEQKYPNELVVIGVHSAKFDNEKDSENIRRAIVRYEIEHPVVNDADMIIWRKFGTRAWPTIAVIDPEGNYLGSQSGEGTRELFEVVINRLIEYHRAQGTLDPTPIQFDLEKNRVQGGVLKFPGKVLGDPVGQRLFISDSNHNRIVVAGLDGNLQHVIGSGRIGADDGSFSEASFDHPQGMELVGQQLYVADTENHLIRVIDLKEQTVTTLAGTGEQARTRRPGGPLLETALNSPWALVHVDGTLYIAMAGPHQIWQHKLGSDSLEVYAGSGREDVLNGSLSDSAFAQPSGIVTDDEFLYVVDSEGSAVRRVPVDPQGTVSTLVGTSELPRGQSLFAFGDRDGIGDEARLQHPIGIAIDGATLYVADSYNHKIRKVDLKTRECTSFLGTGQPGADLSKRQLSEPAGLTVVDGRLFIADTNNHRIVQVDLKSGTASEFIVAGLTAPAPAKTRRADQFDPRGKATPVELQAIPTAAEKLQLTVKVQLPGDYKLNTESEATVRVRQTAGELLPDDFVSERHAAQRQEQTLSFELPLLKTAESGTVQIALTFMYCREGKGGLCKVQTQYWTIPIQRDADAKERTVELTVSP